MGQVRMGNNKGEAMKQMKIKGGVERNKAKAMDEPNEDRKE
jgi:hypothetical protein